MASQKQVLIEALTALALEPDQQLQHLRDIGFSAGAESIDELALEFHDAALSLDLMLQLGEIDSIQHAAVQAIDRLLSRMSGPSNALLWTAAALQVSHEWREVRAAARDCLTLLKQHP